MKKSRVVGMLFAILALGVTSLMAVSAASAETAEWLCANALTGTHECLILSENLTVMRFEDRGTEASVECSSGAVLNEGWVGPGAEDETTSVVFHETECKASAKALNKAEAEVANKCEKLEKIGPVDLPWKTNLELISGAGWDTLLTVGAGYKIECKTLIGTLSDTCITVAGKEPLLAIDNLPLEGAEFALVDVLFPTKESETFSKNRSEFAKCSLGGAETGNVNGEVLLEGFLSNVASTLEAD